MDIKNVTQLKDHPCIVKSKDINYEVKHGIGYELFHYMKKYKNHIAQHILENNYEESYGSLLRKSISTAIKLRSKSLSDNPIIAICAENHSNSCIPLIAATFLGYRAVTFDGFISVTDAAFLLGQVTPAIMFVDEKFLPTMEAAMRQLGNEFDLVVFGRYDKYPMFDEYLYENDENEYFEPVKLRDTQETGIILFSSGTSGLTKGICLPHHGILTEAYSVGVTQCISSESVIYYLTTLNWITSVSLMISCAMFGATRVICPISRGWEAIHKYKVTHISISPYMASILMDTKMPTNVQTNSVKSIWTAGTYLNSNLKAKLTDAFPSTLVAQSYGQTEASGWITMFPYAEQQTANKKPTSVGKLFPRLCAKIIDTETEEILGANDIGELHLKCDLTCMNGYFSQDASNQFDSEGWLKTGDLFYYDEDECFFIIGRCKEVLKYREFHIPPQMLEEILESHPAVDKAVVIGITHEVDGDHPMGLVVLHQDKNITSEILEQYVEKQVQERQRLRAGVKIIKEIPCTRTGKPLKRVLKQMVENGKL